jgi:hypothetical protein
MPSLAGKNPQPSTERDGALRSLSRAFSPPSFVLSFSLLLVSTLFRDLGLAGVALFLGGLSVFFALLR